MNTVTVQVTVAGLDKPLKVIEARPGATRVVPANGDLRAALLQTQMSAAAQRMADLDAAVRLPAQPGQ